MLVGRISVTELILGICLSPRHGFVWTRIQHGVLSVHDRRSYLQHQAFKCMGAVTNYIHLPVASVSFGEQVYE